MGCKLSAEWRGVVEKGMRIDSLFSSHPSASILPLLLTSPNSILGVYSSRVLRLYYMPTPFPPPLLTLAASLLTPEWKKWLHLLSLLSICFEISHLLLHLRVSLFRLPHHPFAIYSVHKLENEFLSSHLISHCSFRRFFTSFTFWFRALLTGVDWFGFNHVSIEPRL
jgi:hypothetical protein